MEQTVAYRSEVGDRHVQRSLELFEIKLACSDLIHKTAITKRFLSLVRGGRCEKTISFSFVFDGVRSYTSSKHSLDLIFVVFVICFCWGVRSHVSSEYSLDFSFRRVCLLFFVGGRSHTSPTHSLEFEIP